MDTSIRGPGYPANFESAPSCRPEQLVIPNSQSSAALISVPGGRVFFARVDFQPEHCYGAKDTLLWQVERDPNLNEKKGNPHCRTFDNKQAGFTGFA